MSGCIKTPTRDHRDRLLNKKRNDHVASIHILEQGIKAIMTNHK